MKKEYKLIASDLDGTLLNSEQNASPENLEAIREITRRGVKFVPSTGRCIGQMPEDIVKCEDIRYVISSDGAVVWDKQSDSIILSQYIPSDLVAYILDEASKVNSFPMVHENRQAYQPKAMLTEDYLKTCRVKHTFYKLINGVNVSLPNFDEYIKASDKVELFCIFFEKDDELDEFCRKMEATGRLSIASSAPYNVEIYSVNAGKGNTLKALASKLGVDISDVVAVGDSLNDKSLIEAAGLGLAMQNACDELKDVAERTICHFSEHSAKYILENIL